MRRGGDVNTAEQIQRGFESGSAAEEERTGGWLATWWADQTRRDGKCGAGARREGVRKRIEEMAETWIFQRTTMHARLPVAALPAVGSVLRYPVMGLLWAENAVG